MVVSEVVSEVDHAAYREADVDETEDQDVVEDRAGSQAIKQ